MQHPVPKWTAHALLSKGSTGVADDTQSAACPGVAEALPDPTVSVEMDELHQFGAAPGGLLLPGVAEAATRVGRPLRDDCSGTISQSPEPPVTAAVVTLETVP
jgi:hypothetical protein